MMTGTPMHVLPALPYAVSALEPHVDTRTMILHHDQHHASYVRALTHALEQAPEPLRRKTAKWLLLNANSVPAGIRTAVHNNAGGHVNHSLLWRAMAPGGGGAPSGALADAIDEACGSFEKFKIEFNEAGAKIFGSGWVWLVKPQQREAKLQVLTTSGHDNPLTQGSYPLLLNDVWEHAYYLKHEDRRAEYLAGWWAVVNWKEAARRFDHSLRAAELPSATAEEPALAVSN